MCLSLLCVCLQSMLWKLSSLFYKLIFSCSESGFLHRLRIVFEDRYVDLELNVLKQICGKISRTLRHKTQIYVIAVSTLLHVIGTCLLIQDDVIAAENCMKLDDIVLIRRRKHLNVVSTTDVVNKNRSHVLQMDG